METKPFLLTAEALLPPLFFKPHRGCGGSGATLQGYDDWTKKRKRTGR